MEGGVFSLRPDLLHVRGNSKLQVHDNCWLHQKPLWRNIPIEGSSGCSGLQWLVSIKIQKFFRRGKSVHRYLREGSTELITPARWLHLMAPSDRVNMGRSQVAESSNQQDFCRLNKFGFSLTAGNYPKI